MDPNDSSDLIRRLAEAGSELRELISQAHGATKDLAAQIRLVEKYAKVQVTEAMTAIIVPELNDLSEKINNRMEVLTKNIENDFNQVRKAIFSPDGKMTLEEVAEKISELRYIIDYLSDWKTPLPNSLKEFPF